MINKNEIVKDILSIDKLIFSKKLIIPEYQRPYKWTIKNVNQLIDDILLHSDKSAYRIGTIVLHKDDELLNIVDGQQRLLTLSLMAFELLQTELGKKIISYDVSNLSIASLNIKNLISKHNIKNNQLHIRSRINEFSRDETLFFFEKCQMVYIELNEISEAFQFFDSQNTRGKDLAPHDLLKAFHLREMINNTEKERSECVSKWEEVSDDLNPVFEDYLYKVRQWSKGRSGLYFSKDKVDVFKGINIENNLDYNFVKSYSINHFFIENYNNEGIRNIDKNMMSYPFQIDQVIINGKRFFEYTHHYAKLIKLIESTFHSNEEIKDNSLFKFLKKESKISLDILNTLRNYKGKNRTGDLYLKNAFNCSLLHYIDKFGTYKLNEAIIKFFIWSYSIRLEQQAVQQETVDNRAKDYTSFFRIIRESNKISDVIHRKVNPAKYVGNGKAVKNIEEIVKIFQDLNAIEN
jgi:uncharacterized protein with ParB-like and HNH nuclease domain